MFLCACVNYVNKLIPIKSAKEHSLKIGFLLQDFQEMRNGYTAKKIRKYRGNHHRVESSLDPGEKIFQSREN